MAALSKNKNMLSPVGYAKLCTDVQLWSAEFLINRGNLLNEPECELRAVYQSQKR